MVKKAPPLKVLILGGTREAAQLADSLYAQGIDVTTSLAGRTQTPKKPAGKVRIGGFGGAEGLSQWLQDNNITRLIDATHPFAQNISANAKRASQLTNIPLQIHKRLPWQKQAQDCWIEVENLAQSAQKIPKGARVFLALGSQHLSHFHHRDDVHFTIRMVDQPSQVLPFAQQTLILAKPAKDWQKEAALMQTHNITHIVCRNSGGEGAYAKIKAAQSLKLPVIIVKRPI